MAKRGRPPYPDVLTPRQQEVLSLVRRGLSNDEIARELGISADGAKFHVSEILSRLGVTSRHEAARWRPEAPERASAWLRTSGFHPRDTKGAKVFGGRRLSRGGRSPRLGRCDALDHRRRTYRYESRHVTRRKAVA